MNLTSVDDNPVVFQKLPAGNYTVNVTAVGIGNVSIGTVELITVSDAVTNANTPTTEGTIIMINNCIMSLHTYYKVCIYTYTVVTMYTWMYIYLSITLVYVHTNIV